MILRDVDSPLNSLMFVMFRFDNFQVFFFFFSYEKGIYIVHTEAINHCITI